MTVARSRSNRDGRCKRFRAGFSLLEVLVALTVGILILGGVMKSNSASLNFERRVKEKSEIWPVLDYAAQFLIEEPEYLDTGVLKLENYPGEPEVEVALTRVEYLDEATLAEKLGGLYRVRLEYRKVPLEFSVLISEGITGDVEAPETAGSEAPQGPGSGEGSGGEGGTATPGQPGAPAME
jgi:prepilin-type N-terminal cleavage/methylation domain-containing protein